MVNGVQKVDFDRSKAAAPARIPRAWPVVDLTMASSANLAA
jgi:hypothetical protein